jgi:hypothetical protein
MYALSYFLIGIGIVASLPYGNASALPASEDIDMAARARVVTDYGRLPMSFEANQGQADRAVRFLARGQGYDLFLTPTEAVLSLHAGAPAALQAKSRLEGTRLGR